MESENTINSTNRKTSRKKLIVIALIPLIVLSGMLVFLLGPGMSILKAGIPLPEVTIEKIEFQNDKIVAFIRNTGPEGVEIAQADINDRIIPAAIEPSKTLSRLAEAKLGCSVQAPAQPMRKALRNCASQAGRSEKSPNGP